MQPPDINKTSSESQTNQTEQISLLYVDDEEDLLILSRIYLERLGGFQVDISTSAKEALNSPLIRSYDAIVSDYQMPEMDGIAFLKAIRETCGDIPFILFTGKGREEIVIEAINNGADFYLQKGGDAKSQFAELSHKIRQAVRRRQSEKARKEQFDELVKTKEALQESESKFRAIVETIPDAIWEITLKGIFSYISPQCQEIIGYTPDELLGTSFFSLLNPEGKKLLETLFENANDRKPGLFSFYLPAIHKNGGIRILNCRSYPLINAGGKITGFRGVTSDVTKRVHDENALYESELRLRSFFEATGEAVSLIDEDGIILEWNASSERISGISKEEALGKYAWDLMFHLLPPERHNETIREKIKNSIQTTLKTGRSLFQEPKIIESIRSDGKRIYTRQIIFPIKTEKGYRLGSISQDITEERYMADALMESEKRFRGMAERSPDLIIILDNEMKISYISPSARTIIGYDPGELAGIPGESACEQVFSQSSINLSEIIRKIKNNEPVENLEIQILKKDKSEVFVNLYAIPVIREGILSGIQISMRDITNNKKIERDLRDSEEKFLTLFNRNPVPLTLVSALNGVFTNVNDAFVQSSGYSHNDVIGKSPHELNIFIHETEFAHFSTNIREKNSIHGMDLQCRSKSGEIKDCRFSSSIVIIRGEPHILSTIEDITSQKKIENAIREREERYRLIMKNAHEGILINELTPYGPGTFIDANESACNILGMSFEELETIKLVDLDTPEMKKRTPVILKEILKNRHAAFQTHYYAKDNQEKIIDISVSLFNINQKTTMLSIIRDITEQKAAESAMNAMVSSMVGATGAESLDRITESISAWLMADCVIIGEITPDNKYIKTLSMLYQGKKIPDRLYRLQETPCEDIIINGFRFYPDNAGVLFQKNRFIVDLDIHGYIGAPLKNSEGKIIGILCIISGNPFNPEMSIREIIDIIAVKAGSDIERTHIEQALIENEQILAETMDMAKLVNWEYNYSSHLFTFNDRFYALYGTTAEQEGGYTMDAQRYTSEFVYPADVALVTEEAMKTVNTTDPHFISDFEHRIIRRDGDIRYFSVHVRAIFDEEGMLIMTHGANQDITERKIIEEALLKANRQLNLLSSITRHDILNKITSFYGYLQLLEMESDNPELLEYIQKMSENITKIQTQIEFSRIYQDLGSHKPIWLLLDEILPRTSMTEMINLNCNVSGISIFADPMLEKVFYNLLDNSVRHGGKVSEISVSAYEKDNTLIIIWKDNGDGIPAEHKELIFERGFGKNTGYGLFLVREILSLTGITIEETGEEGKGAIFKITVPSGSYRISN